MHSIKISFITLGFVVLMSTSGFAYNNLDNTQKYHFSDSYESFYSQEGGIWKRGKGWTYTKPDGTEAIGWALIDGNYHYFDENGWMYMDTYTPDGYYVNSDGVWVKDASVQSNEVITESFNLSKDNSELNRKVLEDYRLLLSTDPELQPYVGTNTDVYFGVIDVDKDGIYELDIYTNGNCNANMRSFLLYYNEESQNVKKVSKFYEPLYILPNNQFFTYYSHMGLDFPVFSKVNGDWIQTESWFGYQDLKHPGDTAIIETYSNMATGRDDMVELTQTNIEKYLSGDGLSTESNDVNDIKKLIVLAYEAMYEFYY